MPTVKEFEANQSKHSEKSADKHGKKKHAHSKVDEATTGAHPSRRRPGMESEAAEAMMDSAETHVHNESTNKTKIEFKGSDYLRAQMPKAFELAEKVADDWKADGNFEDVPLHSPWAKKAVTMGLQKAKGIEKKLEEKGVISGATFFAKTGLEFVKSKLHRNK